MSNDRPRKRARRGGGTPIMATKKKPESSRRIDLLISPETYREIAEKQRARIHAIADKIERGEPLTEWERPRAALMLRLSVDLIKTKQSKKGHPPEICQGTVALEFWMLVKERGMSKNDTYGHLADEWDCSIQSIKNAVKKYGDAALHLGGWISEGESK